MNKFQYEKKGKEYNLEQDSMLDMARDIMKARKNNLKNTCEELGVDHCD